MRTRIDGVAAVVPVHDEQDTLAECLTAIDVAAERLRAERPDVAFDRIVVLDACTDGSAVVAAGVPGWHVVVVHARSVGRARAAGSAVAMARAGAPAHRMWTAHTDADSLVPEHWLTSTLAAASAGADLVLGTVEPRLDGATLTRWRSRHETGDDHPHVHGANLGVRVDALVRLGGWPDVVCGEDVELVRRATAAGLAVARLGGSMVRTSARRTGRAPAGFSSYLRELDAGLEPDRTHRGDVARGGAF